MSADWSGDLFDLMVRHDVRVEIEGTIGEVHASIAIKTPNGWLTVVEVVDYYSHVGVMQDLTSGARAWEVGDAAG